MSRLAGFALGMAAAIATTVPVAAASLVLVGERQERAGRDCTPYNGPFGFYGNVWCQPPNEQSYMRNLGSRWPMEPPPSLKNPKPRAGNSTDW